MAPQKVLNLATAGRNVAGARSAASMTAGLSAAGSKAKAATPASTSSSKTQVQLHKTFSALQENLTRLADGFVHRSATIPYIDGHKPAEHIAAVGKAVESVGGGLQNNLLTTSHRSDGRGLGTGDGETVAFGVHELKTAIIPKDNIDAIKSIASATKLLNEIAHLIGKDDPSVKSSRATLDLIAKTGGQGMTLYDFMVALNYIANPPIKAVARRYSKAHPDGMSPKLRGPHSQSSENEGAEAAPQGGASQAIPGATPTAVQA